MPLVFILEYGILVVSILCLDLQLFEGLEGEQGYGQRSGNSHPVFSF